MSLERRRKKYGRHESELLQCLMGFMSQTASCSDAPTQHSSQAAPCPRCQATHHQRRKSAGATSSAGHQQYTDTYHEQVPNNVGFPTGDSGCYQRETSAQVTYQSQETLHAYQNYVQSASSRRKEFYSGYQSDGSGQRNQAPRDRWPSPPPPIILPPLPKGTPRQRPRVPVTDAVWTPRTPGVLEHRAASPLTLESAWQPSRRSRIDYHEAPIYHDTEMYKSKSLSGMRGETGSTRQNRVTFATPTRSHTMPRLRSQNQEVEAPYEDATQQTEQWPQHREKLRYRSQSHSPQRSRHYNLCSQDSTDSTCSQGARPKSFTGSPQTPKVYLPRVPSAHSHPLGASTDRMASPSAPPVQRFAADTPPSLPVMNRPVHCDMCQQQDSSCKVCHTDHPQAASAATATSSGARMDEEILAAAAALTAMSTGSAPSSYLPRDPEVYLGERHQRAMVRLCALLWVANQVIIEETELKVVIQVYN